MAIKKVIEIDVDVVRANGGLENFTENFTKTEQATKSLKAQLREAVAEVQQLSEKYGESSKEAITAAKRAAELRDKIEDANDAIQAFKGEGTFLATSKALGSVASGFAAVQGAMGLVGVESDQVQEQLLKVQSAMALADGLAGLEDAGRSFKQLATVAKSYTIVQKAITAGQWLWNAAMAANPIGAIVAVVVALIAAGYALVKMFIASSEATKNAEKANKELNKSLETNIKQQKLANQEADLSRDAQLKMAKASGKSAEEIRKLSLELANQEVQQKMANAQTLRAIAIEAMRVAGLEDATEAEKETAKNALKAFNDANDALKASVLNRRKLIIDNRVAEVQEATDAREKEKEKQKKHNEELLEKQKEAFKKKLELEKKQAEEFLAFKVSISNAEIELDLQLKKDADAVLKELNQSGETPAKKLLIEFEEKKAILEADNRSTLELQSKFIADSEALEEERRLKEKELEDKAFNDKLLKEQQLTDAKRGFAMQALALVSEVAGRGSKVGKAVAVAQATMSGIEGVQNAYTTAQKSPITALFPGYPIVQAGLAGVFSALQIKKILSTNVGSASPSSVNVSGGGGAPAPPQFNLVGQSSTNQLTQTIAGQQQQPIQAFVVGSEVTTQQSLDRNAQQTSVFG